MARPAVAAAPLGALFTLALVTLSFLFSLSGCSTVHVNVPVMRPAEINMARYRQIGVERFEGRHGAEVANLLQQELVNSGRFQVVNREHLAKIMRELQLSASDLSDPSKAVRLGKQLPASALIFGHVEDSEYSEEPLAYYDYETTDSKGNKSRHRRYTRTGTARVRVTFHIDDVETGQVLTSRTFQHEERTQTSAVDRTPAPIDPHPLVVRGREAVVARFMRSIVPYVETERAVFRKDGKLPQLETAITYCETGQWERALEVVTSAIELGERQGLPSKVLGMAYWNRGIISKYLGHYQQARTDVQRAFEYTNEREFLGELGRIDAAADAARRLQEQNATAAGGT